MYLPAPSLGRNFRSTIQWLLGVLTLFLMLPNALHAQARVDLVQSGSSSQGQFFEYRIVGASFSAVDKLKRFEKVNQETNTFSSFEYDETTHICRVEIGAMGADRDEGIIRYFIGQAVGVTAPQEKGNSSEWADDDPRHGQTEAELPTAIPTPTDPNNMPDWSHLNLPNSNNSEKGGQE